MKTAVEKKTIVGRDIRDRGTSKEQKTFIDEGKDLMAKYFHATKIFCEMPPAGTVMGQNSAYFWDGAYDLVCPKANMIDKVTLACRRDYSPKDLSIARNPDLTADCIGFKVNGGSLYAAFWFPKEKSLVCFWNGGLDLWEAVTTWLETNGHLPPISGIAADVPVMEVIEIHFGKEVKVNIPKPSVVATVGCDPEFEVLKDGEVIVPPSIYGGTGEHTEIGRDGCGSQLELRPKAGSVEEVVENIRTLMGKLKHSISVVGDRHPLGGHIHVGLGTCSTPTPELLKLLDYFLGERTIDLSGKARESYRKIGAFERKNWGFEYRTPPSAIFANPEFARLSLLICKNVTENYTNGRTFKITIPNPVAEDYINYCGFTGDDYLSWVEQITRYKELLQSPEYSYINFSHFWDAKKPQFDKPKKQSVDKPKKHDLPPSADRCSDPTCVDCYPATAARAAEERASHPQQGTSDAQPQPDVPVDRSVVEELASRLNVSFGDDWTTRAQARLLFAIQNHTGGRRLRNPAHCYGLHLNRGMITVGYNVPGIQCQRSADGPYCGFPRIVRDARGDDWQRFLDAAGQDIVRIYGEHIDAAPIPPIPVVTPHGHTLTGAFTYTSATTQMGTGGTTAADDLDF